MFVLPAQKDFKEHIIRSCYASDHHECTNYVTSATSAENQQNIPWNFQDNRSLTKTQNNKWTAIKTAASSGTHAWHLLPAIVLIVPVAGYAFDRVLTLLQHQFQLLHLPLAVDGVRQRRQHWTTSFNHRCTLHAINSYYDIHSRCAPGFVKQLLDETVAITVLLPLSIGRWTTLMT